MQLNLNQIIKISTLLLVLCIASGLRFAYVTSVSIEEPIRADAFRYTVLAFNTVENGVYSLDAEAPYSKTSYLNPGYPLFLAFIVANTPNIDEYLKITQLIQAGLSSLTLLILYFAFKPRFSFWPTAVGLSFVALSPHLIIYSGYVLTETLFVFFISLGFFFYFTGKDRKSLLLLFIGGVIWGMAYLTRPALLFFPIGLLLFFVIFVRRDIDLLKGHVVLLLGFLLMWLPWKMYLFDAPKEHGPAAASFTLGTYPDLIHKTSENRGYPAKEDPNYVLMKKDLPTAGRYLIEKIKSEPFEYVKWYLVGKPIMFWSAYTIKGQGGAFQYPVISSIYHHNVLLQYVYRFMLRIHKYLVLSSMFFSLFFIIRSIYTGSITNLSHTIICSGLLLFYFTAVHMVFAPLPRYSVPLQPISYIVGVYSLYRIVEILCTRFFRSKTMNINYG